MARILPSRMALAAASAAYVADPNKAQYLLTACHQLQSDGRTIHLSDAVLRAHWRTDAGMDALHVLSVTYRIVPRPLSEFIDHCLRRGVSILHYLHPCSLFEDPELASRVYDYLGNVLGPRPEVLEVLWHLSSTRSSNAHAHHVLEMLHAGISEAAPSNAALLLTLASRYMDATQIALLDMGALGRLMVSGQGLTANIMSLVRRMEPHQRVLLAKPMAYEAARTNDGIVIFQLQQLSRHPEFAVAVAAAVRSYQHRPYVDRLGIETSLQLVPYLIGSRAYTGLSRLAAARPRFAVSAGVYTALLSANRAVPAYPDAVAHPYAAHEVAFLGLRL